MNSQKSLYSICISSLCSLVNFHHISLYNFPYSLCSWVLTKVCSSYCICITSLNPHNNPIKYQILSPFYKQGNWDRKSLMVTNDWVTVWNMDPISHSTMSTFLSMEAANTLPIASYWGYTNATSFSMNVDLIAILNCSLGPRLHKEVGLWMIYNYQSCSISSESSSVLFKNICSTFIINLSPNHVCS